MDWDDLRHFLALARLGSVRAAGQSLRVSHSTVARRVEALEARLAVRLFDRNRDGYTLTEAGTQMLPGAERVELEMAAMERGLLGQDERLSGAVVVTSCDNFVAEVALRGLQPFCAQYPDIDLRFVTNSRSFDLSKREADIAIRTLGRGTDPPGFLLGKRIAPVKVANYVAVAHAHRLDPGNQAAPPRWISGEDRDITGFLVNTSSYPDLPIWGAFSSLELLTEAACKGLGIVMLPCYVGDAMPALQRLDKPDVRHLGDLWLLGHPDLRDNARIRAARAAIAQTFADHSDLFAGALT